MPGPDTACTSVICPDDTVIARRTSPVICICNACGGYGGLGERTSLPERAPPLPVPPTTPLAKPFCIPGVAAAFGLGFLSLSDFGFGVGCGVDCGAGVGVAAGISNSGGLSNGGGVGSGSGGGVGWGSGGCSSGAFGSPKGGASLVSTAGRIIGGFFVRFYPEPKKRGPTFRNTPEIQKPNKRHPARSAASHVA